MNEREEKAARRKLLMYYLHLEEIGFPGAEEVVHKIGELIKDPFGAKIEVIHPDGKVVIYYGQKAVMKRYRIGAATLVKHLNNGEPDPEGRRYRYA